MKFYRPTTPSRRHTIALSRGRVLTAGRPYKPLTRGGRRRVGRNSDGKITMRGRGGGAKRKYRQIDFKYDKKDIAARVETVEYDPNRSGFIARVLYKDGERRYVLAPREVKVGDFFIVSEKAEKVSGNRMPIGSIPIGSFAYNIELKPGGGARLARSAGSQAEVVAHEGGYTHIKLPSSELRKVISTAYASLGAVSNPEHRLKRLGKAGRSRLLGRRPSVRGSAMNPVDHPHGGGEGRAGRGRRRAVSKWGKSTGKRHKTRRTKKYSNVFIINRRKVGKRRR